MILERKKWATRKPQKPGQDVLTRDKFTKGGKGVIPKAQRNPQKINDGANILRCLESLDRHTVQYSTGTVQYILAVHVK